MQSTPCLKNEGTSLDEHQLFESTIYKTFVNALEKSLPIVFGYLKGQDNENPYQSDFALSYILIAVITHYIKILYQKNDLENIREILFLFNEILISSKVGRNHIIGSFCDIIGHYPDVLNGILPLMPQELRYETIATNQEILRNSGG